MYFKIPRFVHLVTILHPMQDDRLQVSRMVSNPIVSIKQKPLRHLEHRQSWRKSEKDHPADAVKYETTQCIVSAGLQRLNDDALFELGFDIGSRDLNRTRSMCGLPVFSDGFYLRLKLFPFGSECTYPRSNDTLFVTIISLDISLTANAPRTLNC
ncbi:hypothetical protein BGAL_0032g00150 [Botrytis galanthina]|uniref:Uncharacterized protein n=1 Tax=Botrytis galanthina TaxID=278940 RepID=A0A4S8R812_9HELO|nr:hypothetical protein BGAL_0032g00150 [Botrytis galanthina]